MKPAPPVTKYVVMISPFRVSMPVVAALPGRHAARDDADERLLPRGQPASDIREDRIGCRPRIVSQRVIQVNYGGISWAMAAKST